jgi:hypothetical protein
VVILSLLGLLVVTGCESDQLLAPDVTQGLDPRGEEGDWDTEGLEPFQQKDTSLIFQDGSLPPAGLVTAAFAGESLEFWPYTGVSFDGEPKDPINLVFVGEARPLQIRAALLALDGDRVAFGFPPAYPFDATWTDAIGGDVQTTYSEGNGWIGSVVQLQLGDYEPVRFHLRLFRTGSEFGDGVWTLGGAHFEVMIPGTADHQVLSWELAQDLVVADLMRSGLLDVSAPMQPTGPIHAAPAFRDIPPEIYNGLPDDLKMLTGGPSGTVTDPVPIPSEGEATILNLAQSALVVPGSYTTTLTLTYDQYVPKPFCSGGPYDWLYVSGPVDFHVDVTVTANGRYRYRSGYTGLLQATPVDISTGMAVGEPFQARVGGHQRGVLSSRGGRVLACDRRLTRPVGGVEIFLTRLKVSTFGRDTYHALTHCLDDTE